MSGTGRVAAGLSLVLAALVPVAQFAVLFPLVGPLPTWDQWSMVELWEAHFAGRSVLPLLLEPYNGHANGLARAVLFVLGLATDWSIRAEVVAIYVVALAALAILLVMIARSDRRLLILAFPVSLVVFSFAQYENFLAGYQLGQQLSHTAALAAILLSSGSAAGPLTFAGALAASVLATFSYGTGLAVWPAIGVLLLARGESRWRLLIWSVFAAASTAAAISAAAAVAPPFDPASFMRFIFGLIGRAFTWSRVPSELEAILTGALVVALLAVLIRHAARRGSLERALPWLGVTTFCLVAAAMIGMGRHPFGWEQALVSHYVTTVYPLGVATLALCGIAALEETPHHTGRRSFPLWTAALVVLVSCAASQAALASAHWLPVLRHWSSLIEANNCKLLLGTATDEDIRTTHHPDVALVRRQLDVLRRYGLAVFSDPRDAAERSALCTESYSK